MVDYREVYNLETYLFETVSRRFQQQGWLSAFDCFCIVIWKANRAKSKIASKLLCNGPRKYQDLDQAVRDLTHQISDAADEETKMRVLLEDWKFRLPMASAVLTVLEPDKFTIYDVRVAKELKDDEGKDFSELANLTAFEKIYSRYREYRSAVQAVSVDGLSLPTLREKDRYLWGKSFYDQLRRDVARGFPKDGRVEDES